jgi:hypothetical protein
MAGPAAVKRITKRVTERIRYTSIVRQNMSIQSLLHREYGHETGKQ